MRKFSFGSKVIFPVIQRDGDDRRERLVLVIVVLDGVFGATGFLRQS